MMSVLFTTFKNIIPTMTKEIKGNIENLGRKPVAIEKLN